MNGAGGTNDTTTPTTPQTPAAPVQNYGSSNTFDNIAAGVAAGGTGTGTTNPTSQAPGGTTQQEAPPSAATSPYEYQQYIASSQIVLGPEFANLLGLSADSPVSGDSVVKAYYNLSYANLVKLQAMLYYGGFYLSTAGTSFQGQPVLGTFNVDGFNALSNAILAMANGEGPNLSAVVAQKIAQNSGIVQQEAGMPAEMGGGNAYQVNLPNPDDIYQTAYGVFEQALGRAPNQQELDAIQAALDSQTTAYQQSINQQNEQMAQTQYQAKISSQSKVNTPIVVGPDGKPTTTNAQQVANGKTPPPAQPTGGKSSQGGPAKPNQPSGALTQIERQQGILPKTGPVQEPMTGGPVTPVPQQGSSAATTPTPGNPAAGAPTAPSTTGVPTSTPELQSPGNTYIPSTTTTNVQAASPSGAAFTEASTGQNAVPYLFNQYLNAYNAIVQLIKGGGMGG